MSNDQRFSFLRCHLATLIVYDRKNENLWSLLIITHYLLSLIHTCRKNRGCVLLADVME